MAEPLADGGEAHASVDELRRVGVAQLVQGGVDAGGSRVPDPVLVDRLIAQRTTPTILFSFLRLPVFGGIGSHSTLLTGSATATQRPPAPISSHTILVCNATIRGEQGDNSIQHT